MKNETYKLKRETDIKYIKECIDDYEIILKKKYSHNAYDRLDALRTRLKKVQDQVEPVKKIKGFQDNSYSYRGINFRKTRSYAIQCGRWSEYIIHFNGTKHVELSKPSAIEKINKLSLVKLRGSTGEHF